MPFKEIEDAVLGPVPVAKPEPKAPETLAVIAPQSAPQAEPQAEESIRAEMVHVRMPEPAPIAPAPIDVQARVDKKPAAAVQVPHSGKPRK